MARSLSEVEGHLAAYDLLDLAAGTGGLQLIPANAGRQPRFDLLASIIPSIRPAEGIRPALTIGRWRTLLNTPPLGGGGQGRLEDPAENLFTSSLTFDGGPAVVFPGSAPSSVEITRLLIKALFFSPGIPPAYRREMRDLTYAVLRLSDEVARRAGLPRNVLPDGAPNSAVVIPSTADLARLKQAVTFDEASLVATLAPVSPDVLRPLIVDAGTRMALYEADPSAAPHYSTPVLKLGAQYVVLLPSALLVGWRHRVVTAALAAGIERLVAARFRQAVAQQVANSLAMMGFIHQSVRFPVPLPWADETFWGFDVDKVAHVLVITDDLTGYRTDEVFGAWEPAWPAAEIEQRLLTFHDIARAKHDQLEGILQLIVFQGVGRMMSLGLSEQSKDCAAHILITSEPDLAVIARQAVGDRLALWKFARALSRLHKTTAVAPLAGTLDQYAFYAAHRHSFYASDEARPHFLIIYPDIGAQLRFKDARDFDLHGVVCWGSQAVMDMQRLYEGSGVPVYMPEPRAQEQVELLLEKLPIAIWIFESPNVPRDLAAMSFELCETIAYWLWQVSPSIEREVGLAATQVQQLGFEVTIIPSDAWLRPGPTAATDPWVEATTPAEDLVAVRFTSGAKAAFSGADNGGERRLLTVLLDAFAATLANITGRLVPWDIAAIVERHAPLGPKKKIVAYPADVNLQLRPGDLPRARHVQEAEVEQLIDELGPQVASELGLELGKIPAHRATEVLNRTVAILFARLEAAVAAISPTGLVELLLAQHESLLYQSAKDRLTLPTRLACFGDEGNYLGRVATQSQETIRASQANRFLVEYVAARPPRGERALSLDTFDHLMALAEEIIAKGMLSDAIQYELSDIDLSILPSGRLGMSREGRYVTGTEQFRQYQRRAEVEMSLARFSDHWREVSAEGKPESATDLDVAAVAEFGFSLTSLVDLTAAAVTLGEDLGEPARMDRAAATERLAMELGVERERVDKMIDLLTLRPRDSFLVPGRAVESYPWRFNRDLSYVRRPFIVRQQDGREELLWGMRHLGSWWENIFGLIASGRLKATSQAMKEFMGKLRSEQSEHFNDSVADLFTERTNLIVRHRVKKLGKLRIADAAGRDLGDIDVLVVDPVRRRVLAIETKDFELARTPCELDYEVKKLFKTDDSAAVRHGKRLQWLKDHIPALCDRLEIERGGTWRVSGLIVLSRKLLSPYIHDSPIKVLSIDDLDVATAL